MRLLARAGVLTLLTAATLQATVIVPIDFGELTTSAQAVVYARVIEVTPVVTDDRSRVESTVNAEAIGYMKGDLGRSIVLRVPGGQVGAYRTVMVGAPSFERGDEVVLFLGTRTARVASQGLQPYLVGFSQGVYRVRIDPRTGTRVVIPPPAIATGETIVLTRGTRTPMALEAFAAEVRAASVGLPRRVR